MNRDLDVIVIGKVLEVVEHKGEGAILASHLAACRKYS